MYLEFNGTAIAETGANNGVNLWASGPGQTLQGGDLNDVLGGQSNDTLIGGLGDNWYYLSGTGNVIVQGATGVNTVTTWMDYTLPANIQNLYVSGSGLYAAGNSLDNLVTVDDGANMQLYGAGGNNVLVGGAGTDTFIVNTNTAGTDAIYNWHSGDTVRLWGASSLQTFAQIQAAMVQQGSDVVINDGDHPFVIRNTTIAQFHASDFQLALDATQLGGLTFDDEFNSLSLFNGTSGTWTPHYWYGGIGAYTLTGNNELQLYTAPGFTGSGTTDLGLNPFSISGGVLDIHAQTVTAAQSAAMWNYKYSSGVLTTHDTFAQTYGYFEMRAELPANDGGAWPAFWLVPADGSWPPELDIMEQLSGSPDLIYTTSHTGTTNTAVGAANYIPDPTGFHTYGVLWTPSELTWYVDGVEVFQTATPADMDKPMYMIVNMAVGGWSGTPDWTSADMDVDYVRAYAIPGVTTVQTTLPPPTGGTGGSGGSGGSTSAPAAPTGLADTAIVKGYVNQANDTPAQTLTGSAAAGATVTVYDGLTALGAATADANGNWSYVLGQLADGPHSLTATAANANGTSGSSAALAFTVDTVAPIPTVSNVLASGGGAVISGQTAAGAVVQVFDNNKAVGTATANAAGAWSLKVSLGGTGVHSFTETATDAAGNSAGAPGVTLYASKAQALTGGAGADVLVGRGGDTLTGNGGTDHFVFNASFGKEAVNDFTPGTDQIWIAHGVLPDFTHLMADAKQVGGDVVITVDRNDVLTLHNTTLAGLHGTDFLFF